MTLLRKYKIYILTLWVGIFLLTLTGAFCYFETNKIIQQYSLYSDGIIAIADEHLKNDHLEWDFEYPVDEEYIEELYHVYKFSTKGFHIVNLNLIDLNGKIMFSNNSSSIGTKANEKKWAMLDEINTSLYIPEPKLSNLLNLPNDKYKVDTYSPITINGKLKGYINLEYYAKPHELPYIYYKNLLVPSLILMLSILFIFLVLYLRRSHSIQKENDNTQNMMMQLFDNASDGIIVLDKDKNVKIMNKTMEKMVGMKLGSTIDPLPCKNVLMCHSNEEKLCGKDCPVWRESKDNIIEFDMVNTSNSIMHVSASKSTLKNELTEETMDIMLIRDETSRKTLDLKLQTLEEFENLMNSTLELSNLSSFIQNKVMSLAECDNVYIFNGKTIETAILLNNETTMNTYKELKLHYQEDLVAQSYFTQKLQKASCSSPQIYKKQLQAFGGKSLVSVPLIVNGEMIGALLLSYESEKVLDSQKEKLLHRFAKDIAALMKVYLLMFETNKRREVNERLYNLEIKMQTMPDEKDLPISVLDEIQKITESDFIVYRSTKVDARGISGIGSIQPFKDYSDPGDIMNFTIKWGRSIFIDDFNEPKNLPVEFNDFTLVSNEGLVTIYSLPLIYNNKVLGAILFGSRNKCTLTNEKKNVFRSIVNMLSIHLENKNLHRQIENDATIMERQRISREIHDGLAQNIGFINIQLHRLKKMISKNELVKAVQEIDVVKEAVEESYLELRETIDQLRDITSYENTLEEWMKNYAIDFERTHGINVFLEMDPKERIVLNEQQKVQLTRVIQEIFNNIRKHSKAKNVRILCRKIGSEISVTIEDDGIGFDSNTSHKRKYGGSGLIILKERIQSINGDISVDSALHEGTKIEIQIPIVV